MVSDLLGCSVRTPRTWELGVADEVTEGHGLAVLGAFEGREAAQLLERAVLGPENCVGISCGAVDGRKEPRRAWLA